MAATGSKARVHPKYRARNLRRTVPGLLLLNIEQVESAVPPPERACEIKNETFASVVLEENKMQKFFKPFSIWYQANLYRMKWFLKPFFALRKACYRLTEGDLYVNHDYLVQEIRKSAANAVNDIDADSAEIPEPRIPWFTIFINFCVLFNTAIMAAEHYQMSKAQMNFGNVTNLVFTSIFVVELILRLMSLGLLGYFFDPLNAFDGLITIISLMEVIFLDGSTFNVLRTFRLLRIFRFMKSISSLRAILSVMFIGLKDTALLNLIFLLYVFIATLVGMQLFGPSYVPTDALPSSFDGFIWSFYSVFQVATRDNWPDIASSVMYQLGDVYVIYFIFCVVFGDFILLNLYLAILISSFEEVGETHDEKLQNLEVNYIYSKKSQPAASVGTLVSDHARRMLRLADHKLRVCEDDLTIHKVIKIEKEMLGDAINNIVEEEFSPMEGVELCPFCGEIKIVPFPPPSRNIRPLSPDELHERMCACISLRKMKEKAIKNILKRIGVEPQLVLYSENIKEILKEKTISQPNHRFKPSPFSVDDLFGMAWESGLLLNENADDYYSITSWVPIVLLLSREYKLLELRVGEEQIGRALIAYTHANIPNEFYTNGGVSLWIFGPRNRFRILVTEIVRRPAFDGIILVFIIISSILLALDNPRKITPSWVSIPGHIFTSIFVIEAVMKIIAYGFVFYPTAYLRNGWNILDFLIVAFSLAYWILSAVLGDNALKSLKVLRALRTLRPLRVINRYRGIRIVVSTLLLSLKGIANVAFVTFIVFLTFGIFFSQLLAGKLYSCNDSTMTTRASCIGTYNVTNSAIMQDEINSANGSVFFDGISNFGSLNAKNLLLSANSTSQRKWDTITFNFDNTAIAFVTLFKVATLDNWGDTMFAIIDSTDVDSGPVHRNNPYFGLFIVVFIAICCFFLLNMFVGVIIHSFTVVKEQIDGSSMLTDEQKLWVETQRLMLNFRPDRRLRPANWRLSIICFKIANNNKFEFFMAVIIGLNIIFIAISHYNQPLMLQKVLKYANYIFVGIFIIEAIIKIIALRFYYFKVIWNLFDFFIVIIGIVDVVGEAFIPINFAIFRLLRVFRIMRLFALIKQARNVRILLETLWYSIPSLGNIGAFLILVLFMYGVLGMQLFSTIKRTHGLDGDKNFENFGNSFLYLIQLATLDDWSDVMAGTMNLDDCGNAKNEDCGTNASPLYFISYIIIVSWVMINLFIAIILDNFNTTMMLDKSKLKLSHLKRFAEAWSKFDPEATLLMETKCFPNFLLSMQPPFGISRLTDRKAIMTATCSDRIVEHSGVVHFVETMVPMARLALGVKFTEAELRAHEEHWRKQFPSLGKLRVLRYRAKRVTVDQYFGATYLAAAYRRRMAYRYVNKLREKKYNLLLEWYKEHNVPEDERYQLKRIKDEKLAREYDTTFGENSLNSNVNSEVPFHFSNSNIDLILKND